MSKDICVDCGILLSTHSSVCPVCGFDNKEDIAQETSLDPDPVTNMEDFIPENYPGF